MTIQTNASPAAAVAGDRRFFGHPLALFTLFSTELWERFSYYGMRAILIYYITDTIASGGLGIDNAMGSAVVSIYGTGVYLLSVVGGWFADRMIGAYRATFIGGVIIAAGHVSLSLPAAGFSWIGICLVALGTGFLKPNVSSMVGELYRRDDSRRQAAFSIFYMGINLGSFFSPLIVGGVRNAFGYHAGFIVAAIGMAFALVCFVAGRKLLAGAGDEVPNPITPDERPAVVRMMTFVALGVAALYAVVGLINGTFGLESVVDSLSYLAFVVPILFFLVMYRSPKVTGAERSRLVAYIPLFVAAMLFFMIFEQAATTLSTYARDETVLSFLWFNDIAPEAFQSINPLGIILLAPVFAWVWVRTKDRPRTPYKFAIGLALAAVSFLFLALASGITEGKTGAWVLGIVYLIQTLGELFISPVGLAATTLLAPAAFRGQAMALWFLAPAAGQAITAQLVQVTDGMAPTPFFGGIGAVTLVFAVIVAALGPWVLRRMHSADTMEGVVTSGD